MVWTVQAHSDVINEREGGNGPYRCFPLRPSVTQTRHLLALALSIANWKVETGAAGNMTPIRPRFGAYQSDADQKKIKIKK